MLGVSVAQFSVFSIVPGAYAADFSWGMQLSTLVIFVTTFVGFVNCLHERRDEKRDDIKIRTKAIALIGTFLLLTHFFFGFTYLIGLMNGASYYGRWSLFP
jgi:hypothetical protein